MISVWLLYSLEDLIGYIRCGEQRKTQQHERIKKGILSVSDLKFQIGLRCELSLWALCAVGSWFFQAVLRTVGIAVGHLFGRPSRCSCSESLCCQTQLEPAHRRQPCFLTDELLGLIGRRHKVVLAPRFMSLRITFLSWEETKTYITTWSLWLVTAKTGRVPLHSMLPSSTQATAKQGPFFCLTLWRSIICGDCINKNLQTLILSFNVHAIKQIRLISVKNLFYRPC